MCYRIVEYDALFLKSATMDGRFLIFAVMDDRTYTAAAPPTISEISWVIAAWRALL